MLRENSVATDFVGFSDFWTTCFRHEDSADGDGRTVSQSGHLRAVQSGGRAVDPRAEKVTHRLQAQVEETHAKKQGSAVLVVGVKNLEGQDIGADPRETTDRDPMEGDESFGISGGGSPRAGRADQQFLLNTWTSSGGYRLIIRSTERIASPWGWR